MGEWPEAFIAGGTRRNELNYNSIDPRLRNCQNNDRKYQDDTPSG